MMHFKTCIVLACFFVPACGNLDRLWLELLGYMEPEFSKDLCMSSAEVKMFLRDRK